MSQDSRRGKHVLHLRLRQLAHPQLRIYNFLLIPHWLREKRSQRPNDAGTAMTQHVIRGPCCAVWFVVAGVGGGEGWIV